MTSTLSANQSSGDGRRSKIPHSQFGVNLETVETVSSWHVEIAGGTAPAAPVLHQRVAWTGAKWSLPTRRLPVRCASTADHRRQGFSAKTILPNCLVGSEDVVDESLPNEWRSSDDRVLIDSRDRRTDCSRQGRGQVAAQYSGPGEVEQVRFPNSGYLHRAKDGFSGATVVRRVMFRMLAIHIWRSHENQNSFRRFQ